MWRAECIRAAFVESQRAQALIESLAAQYYRPRNLPPRVEVIVPVGGLHSFCL